MLLGRCSFPRFCATWCSKSVAHGTSLSSLRIFNLSPKLTQLAPFFEINSTVFWASDLAACEASANWILGLEHLTWNRDDDLSLCLKLGSESETKLPQIGSNFTRTWLLKWSEGCLSWLMSKASWWSSNICRCLPYRKGKKVTFLFAWGVGTGFFACGWGTKTFGFQIWDLLVLHVHSSRPVTSLTVRIEWSLFIDQSKMLSLQQVLQNITEHIAIISTF